MLPARDYHAFHGGVGQAGFQRLDERLDETVREVRVLTPGMERYGTGAQRSVK